MTEKKIAGVTAVIPTLQKNKEILTKLIEALERDTAVTEILLIDNSLIGFKHSSSKLTVITPEENLFVNPSVYYLYFIVEFRCRKSQNRNRGIIK